LVTADDVRALLGVLQGDKASKGFLTTTSDFAPKLRNDILLKPFMPAQLELINGKMLLTRLEELAKKEAYPEFAADGGPAVMFCSVAEPAVDGVSAPAAKAWPLGVT